MIAFLEKKNTIQKGTCNPELHSSTIYNSQDIEATKMSINGGIDEEEICTYNGILLSHEKE